MSENYNQQGRFTHADFVQYLQNIDDLASPPKSTVPSSTDIVSPRSPPVKEIFSPNSKSTGVHRTLKAQISDLEIQNKQLNEDLRRTKKELDRKGGGAGEGIHWFSASTMKTKLQQMESQWNQEIERRVTSSLVDANRELKFRLEEQAVALNSEHRVEMENALMRQAADLNANFDHETKSAKQQYDERFEKVLSDVEYHKTQVAENQEQREQFFVSETQQLERQLADVSAQLRAVTEVDNMGRAVELKANEKRWEKTLQDAKDEAEVSRSAAVIQAVEEKQKEMEQILAAREAEMDSAYAEHLSQTVNQCESECAHISAERLEEVKQAGAVAEQTLSQQLERAQKEVEALKVEVIRAQETNTDNLNRLAGLKSSANEAQQKRLTEKYLSEIEEVRREEQEKARTELEQFEEKFNKLKSEEIETLLSACKTTCNIQKDDENHIKLEAMTLRYEEECLIKTKEAVNEVTLTFEKKLDRKNDLLTELEDKVNRLESTNQKQEEQMVQDLAVLRGRLEKEKQEAIKESIAATVQQGPENETYEKKINALNETIRQQKMAHDLLVLNQRNHPSSPVVIQPLPSNIWIGSSIIVGFTMALALLILCSFFLQPTPMMRNQTHIF